MGRLLRSILLGFFLVIPLAALVSRDSVQTALGQIPPESTPPLFGPERTPDPATPTPNVGPDVFLWLDVRRDLELLADDRLGIGVRPIGWTGGTQSWTDPDLPLLTRLDIELLATALINPERRPQGWIGAVASTPFAVARDGRHDLELLADLVYGATGRPVLWTGGDPLLKCNRATQTLVSLLERGGVYRIEVPANDPDFCRNVEIEVTRYTETQILGNPQIGNLFTDELIILSPNRITTDLAIAWLDSGAVRRVGIVPRGTPIRVIGRSYAAFSNMMLIAGDNFEVFVEYMNTTVSPEAFRRLPNVASLRTAPFCFADWCERAN